MGQEEQTCQQRSTMSSSRPLHPHNSSFHHEFAEIFESSAKSTTSKTGKSRTPPRTPRPRPVCKVCGRSFSKPANLKAHERVCPFLPLRLRPSLFKREIKRSLMLSCSDASTLLPIVPFIDTYRRKALRMFHLQTSST